MAEDVPALRDIKPGGKEHPIDRMLSDGEKVTLGGTTLIAHLTAGPHPRLHDMDHARRRKAADLQRRVRVQPARARKRHAGRRGRVHRTFPSLPRAALRRAAWRSSGAVQHDREARAAQAAAPIRSSIPRIAGWRRTSRKRCCAPSSPRDLNHEGTMVSKDTNFFCAKAYS